MVSALLCSIDVCVAALTHMNSSDFLSRLQSAMCFFYFMKFITKYIVKLSIFFYIVKDHSQVHPFPNFIVLHQQISDAEVVSQSSGMSVN